MSLKQIARELRRKQTDEEKELWRALRGRQFAGFKFRRQHTVGGHILDFYCADAKLDVELDGFQHGLPEGIQRDEAREKYLTEHGIETLRFWNHQWQKHRDGCLLEIWNALQRRTGCVRIMNNEECRGAAVCSASSEQSQIRGENKPLALTLSSFGGERETDCAAVRGRCRNCFRRRAANLNSARRQFSRLRKCCGKNWKNFEPALGAVAAYPYTGRLSYQKNLRSTCTTSPRSNTGLLVIAPSACS